MFQTFVNIPTIRIQFFVSLINFDDVTFEDFHRQGSDNSFDNSVFLPQFNQAHDQNHALCIFLIIINDKHEDFNDILKITII